ncbi:MAG: hypothetical protein UU77_C0060G0001, partial [candidate division WWE3 bacterium GW2011_GWC1_41_7]
MIQNEYITSSEAAKLLGISLSSFYRLERKGYISPAEVTKYRKVYTKKSIVELAKRYVQEQEERHKETAIKRIQGSYLYKRSYLNNGDDVTQIKTGLEISKKFKHILSQLRTLLHNTRLRSRRSILPFAAGILLIFIPLAVLVTRHATEVSAWYDDNWNYRVKYTISNSGSADS